MHNISELPAWERLFKKIVWEQMGNLEGKKILDFGSGEGITANHFAGNNEVTAIEPSEEMLSNAWKDYEYTQIVGDANALASFEDETFDFIICHNVLEYIDAKEDVVKALARVLKKDGVIKLEAYSEPLPLQTDRIHVANGTLFLNGELSAQKDFCLNRLPVIYNPDAEKPVRWLKFMEELLNPDDILTLQEYMGYMLLPTTKAQKMMLIIGKGGEGKSRIGLVLRELFGNNMYSCSLQKIEVDAKRSLARSSEKHRLTDMGEIPARAAHSDMQGAV